MSINVCFLQVSSVCLSAVLLHAFSHSGTQVEEQHLSGMSHVTWFSWQRIGVHKRQSQITGVSLKLLLGHGGPHIPLAKERHMAKPKVNRVGKGTSPKESIARKGVIVSKSHNVLSNQRADYLIQILLF